MRLRELRTGALVVATPVLTDPNFARSVVLLLQHDGEGSLGLVLDRPTTIPVDEFLPAWHAVVVPPAVVFAGGPVEPEVGIGLRIRNGSVEIVDLTDTPQDRSQVRVFAGCAGWSPGQLADEIAADAWFVVDLDPSDLTTPDPEDLWSTVLRRQPAHLSIFASYPTDPRMN